MYIVHIKEILSFTITTDYFEYDYQNNNKPASHIQIKKAIYQNWTNLPYI